MERARKPYATAKSASVLTALSTLGPLAGLAVEMALAWRFGASATVDAFRIATLVSFFGQQLFIIQILPNIIVPVFTEYRIQEKEEEAWQVAFSLANLLLIPTTLISLLLFIWPGPVVHLLGPGLVGEARVTATFFVCWFALTFIPLVWTGVAAGILYAQGIFWLPPASQLLSNVVLVIMILAFGRRLGPASLVVGTVLASVGNWILYMTRFAPLMRRAGVWIPCSINVGHAGVRKALRLALPLLGAVMMAQWSAIVINRVLSQLPTGILATFGYAWKMGQLISLLPAALVTILFPRFAESWYSSRDGEFRKVCINALRMALFIVLPLTCIFFVLRVPVVTLLFQRGEFSVETRETAARLFGLFLLGAPASAVCVYLQRILYAVQEMWIPTCIQLISVLCLTVIAPVMAASFGVDGVALVAVVVLPWLTSGGLLLILSQRYRAIRIQELGVFAVEILPLAVAAAWFGGEGGIALGQLIGSSILSLGLTIAGGTSLAILTFYGTTLLLRFPEALQSQRYLQWQRAIVVRRMQNVLCG